MQSADRAGRGEPHLPRQARLPGSVSAEHHAELHAIQKQCTDVPGVKSSHQGDDDLAHTNGFVRRVLLRELHSYFPIDGEGFGNQGFRHNYHFCSEIHTAFAYHGSGTFSFAVFINN